MRERKEREEKNKAGKGENVL